jgi:hypothetical protein
MTRRKKDPTAVERTRRSRERARRHERYLCGYVDPRVTNFLIHKELLREHELEDRKQLGKALVNALKILAGIPL